MERRVRPWINKKIIEYIGEEEATLVDFVCSKVRNIKQCLFLFNILREKKTVKLTYMSVISGDGSQHTTRYFG